MNIIRIWKNRNQIIEGIKNSIFKNEDIEEIAKERQKICISNLCGCYDLLGKGCLIPGSQPCCSQLTGGCGCSLKFKVRSLSSFCPRKYWDAVLTEDEEHLLKEKLGSND
jgi:hypothetical protein